MKRIESCAWLACLTLLFSLPHLCAEQIAVVKEGRINVRGQPSLIGEVVTQLQAGEKVVVLEEMDATRPKTNEPPRWARIQMPLNTPVWVYAPYIEAAAKTVNVSRLNVRAGPGENYSVVGRLERGTAVHEIRRVEDWMEIETPPGTYAFVAADLLAPVAPGAAEAAPRQDAPEATAPPTPAPGLAQTTPTPAPFEPQPAAAAPQPEPAVIPAPDYRTPPQPSELTTLPPEITLPPDRGLQPTAPSVPELTRQTEEAPVTRVVRREGIVRSTMSIQAPTYFELLSPENRRTINYLHTRQLTVNLKDYRGRRIIVTGEEAIDPRWPKTPVIEVQKLELIP